MRRLRPPLRSVRPPSCRDTFKGRHIGSPSFHIRLYEGSHRGDAGAGFNLPLRSVFARKHGAKELPRRVGDEMGFARVDLNEHGCEVPGLLESNVRQPSSGMRK